MVVPRLIELRIRNKWLWWANDGAMRSAETRSAARGPARIGITAAHSTSSSGGRAAAASSSSNGNAGAEEEGCVKRIPDVDDEIA